MNRIKIGIGFGLWRLGMPSAKGWARQAEVGRESASHYGRAA
ncbi:MAG: hypothetical protein WA005_01860 [Candidatus Binataceae bacterium]